MAGCLYICHPNSRFVPGLEQSVLSFIGTAQQSADWRGWTFFRLAYDDQCSLQIRDLYSRVRAVPGPLLLLEPVKSRVIEDMRIKLSGRHGVHTGKAYDEQTVNVMAEAARVAHDRGEPMVPTDYVVGLLLLRKLDQERMWGGNAKGYMWFDDIRKGRGLPEEFAGRVPALVAILLQRDLLIKKTSQSAGKYALNPSRRVEIMKILKSRQFDDDLNRVFNRSRDEVSARALDVIVEYEDPDASP